TAPFTFTLRPGTGVLPEGLSLDRATGVLSGTSVPGGNAQPSSLTVDVRDASGKIVQFLPLQFTVSNDPQPMTVGSTASPASDGTSSPSSLKPKFLQQLEEGQSTIYLLAAPESQVSLLQ